MVSAVLKRRDADSVIRLIHSYTPAKDEKDALAILGARLKSEFRGYVVLDVLASEVKDDEATCHKAAPPAVLI